MRVPLAAALIAALLASIFPSIARSFEGGKRVEIPPL